MEEEDSDASTKPVGARSEEERKMTSLQEDSVTSIPGKAMESPEDELEAQEKLDHFPDDFNQLELLETHRHLIPTGTQSQWPGESDDDDEEKTEEWYQTQEAQLQNSPKDLLLFAAENNRLETVQKVLAAHPDLVNVTDEDLYTPLHRASYNGHLDVVRELIAKGANIHAVTLDGWTPLHSACKWNNTAIASFLLQHGANINAQTEGFLTPLHLAAANRDSRQILELLLMNRYLNPHLTNKLGETAQEIARRTDAFHYLFEMTEYWT